MCVCVCIRICVYVNYTLDYILIMIYSKGKPTIERLIYKQNFPNGVTKPTIVYGEGDG